MITRLFIIFALGLFWAPGLVFAAGAGALTGQDPELLRFARRAFSWYPDSVFKITQDDRIHTASGSYRLVTVDRSCDNQYLSGQASMVFDEVSRRVWVGNVALLPAEAAGVGLNDLRGFLEGFLPNAIQSSLRKKVRLDWMNAAGARGALIPFDLLVDTGYGEYRRRVAVSGDGRHIVLGSPMPLDQDPVSYRRKLLQSSDKVVWDHPGKQPKVEIVEFSDLECPGCKNKWSVIKGVLESFGSTVRHGMVGFPLPEIHPWAFRAASASWCVADQDPLLLVPFKELFYSMQRDMEVSQVTPTSVNFVLGNGLDEQTFRACYLRQSSLDAVHDQLALGHAMGVIATPTYVVNGWLVQMPDEQWLVPMIQRLLEGEEP